MKFLQNKKNDKKKALLRTILISSVWHHFKVPFLQNMFQLYLSIPFRYTTTLF